MKFCIGFVFAAFMLACDAETPRPVSLPALPDSVDTLVEYCDTTQSEALGAFCHLEAAYRLAAFDGAEALAQCNRLPKPTWYRLCVLDVAGERALRGSLDGALDACRSLDGSFEACVLRVSALQSVPDKRDLTLVDLRRFRDQAQTTAEAALDGLGLLRTGELVENVVVARTQRWVLGQGRPLRGFGEARSLAPAAVQERTVRAQEVVRGMGAGAPWSTVRAAWDGQGSWPPTREDVEGCVPFAAPVGHDRRTAYWPGAWRRIGKDVDEDVDIALVTAMFWAGTTDISHLQEIVRRDTREGLAWTAVHLARHLVVEVDDGDLRDLLADAARHPAAPVRELAIRPLPSTHPLPRRCGTSDAVWQMNWATQLGESQRSTASP